MGKILRKTYLASETKASENEDRTLVVKISTSTPDRSRDVVRPEGVVLDNYVRNPVVAFGHNYSGLSIGKTTEIQKTDDGIVAKVEFAPKGVYPLADQLFEMYKGGFMNAWSIGFIPKKWVDLQDGGRDFQEWELLEYSAVLVPDNPEALTLLRSKGVDVEPLEKAMEDFKEEEVIEDKKETEPKDIKEGGENFEYVGEIKEGRVLSEKNRKLVSSVKEQLETLIKTLQELLEASEKPEGDPKAPDQNEVQMAIPLVEAMKIADQVIGRALRDYKREKSGTGQVPDDRRIPIVTRKEGGAK